VFVIENLMQIWLFCRATLPIRGHPSIVGTGDDPVRVQAEKLACLSALFQLAEAGLVSKHTFAE
jgi:hypothetical protein